MGDYCILPPKPQFHRPAPGGAIIELWPNPGAGVLLFYPGSLLCPPHYRLLLQKFYEAGFAIAALHLAGHGFNMGQRSFTFSRLLRQGLLAERWLITQGLGPVAVCGHSQGGILTLAHVSRSSHVKAAFAICAAMPQMEKAITLTRFVTFARYRESILKGIKNLAKVLPSLPVPLPFYLALGKLLAGRLKPVFMGKGPSRLGYPLRYLASLFDAKIKPVSKCPFWLFSAQNDALFTKDLTEEVFREISAPRKEMVWLADGGHMAPFSLELAEIIVKKAVDSCKELGFPLKPSLYIY